MSDELNRLRESLAELAREARRESGSTHPSPEELIAYSAGELPTAAAAALLEHLAVCRSCTRLVLEAPAFMQSPSPTLAAGEPPEPQAAASWQALRARLRAAGEPAEPATAGEGALPTPDRPPPTVTTMSPGWPRRERARAETPSTPAYRDAGSRDRPRFAWVPALALAASLALCTTGFALWLRSAPPVIVSMDAPDEPRGPHPLKSGTTPPKSLRLDAVATALVLTLPEPQSYRNYRVEIVGASGEIRLPAAMRSFNQQLVLILLTRHQLPPGDYRIRVLGVEAGAARLVEEYPVRVPAR